MTECFAPFIHEGPLSRAIHRWKYEDHPEFTQALAEFLFTHARAFLERAPRMVAAIPLHSQRLLRRKYDQSELLTKTLAKLSGNSYRGGLLRRVRPTQRQVGLSELERERNVESAFVATEQGANESVLLVDDVLTTGATARAASRALQRKGFGAVWCITLARAHSSL